MVFLIRDTNYHVKIEISHLTTYIYIYIYIMKTTPLISDI
jgi:hypothetical protein